MAGTTTSGDLELLYGVPGRTYEGLLNKPTTRPLPPGTMTRQRRRTAARAEAKATPRSKV